MSLLKDCVVIGLKLNDYQRKLVSYEQESLATRRLYGYSLKQGQEILVNAVIPARMLVSIAMGGNFPITLPHDLGSGQTTASHPCDWITASLPE